jgi:putative Holliday junction resolvase
MRYLGIDFGQKRVGLALSDEDGKMAFPHSVIANGKNLLEEIERTIRRERIGAIVLGESLDFRGEPNKIMAQIEGFKKELEQKTGLPVHLEPEFLTSAQAERIQGKTEMHDASAAAIILQSYLDKNLPML